MFVGRKKELQQLNKLYNEAAFQCIIMYGRRRVGKTYLLKEWMQGKKGLYYTFEQQNTALLVKKFSDAVLSQYRSKYPIQLTDIRQALMYLADQAGDGPLIIVLDEIQFYAIQDKSFVSMLQHLIDHELMETQIKLVLCGSYVSFMEEAFLAHKSPVFGRRTASFHIKPFRYQESEQLLGLDNRMDAFIAWSILGGMPLYLKQYDGSMSLKDNILYNILEKGAMLHNEPLYTLKQELKEPAIYLAIIEAISVGRSKYNEIETYVGEKIGYYMNTLTSLDIIEKRTPIGEKSTSRRSIYRLKDPYFNFWFRYVSRSYSLIEMDNQVVLYNEKIEPDLPAFIGHRFEDFCIDYLYRHNGTDTLPMSFVEVGPWWGTNKLTRQQEEIDILALGPKHNGIIAECKWRNEKTDSRVLEKLVERAQLITLDDKYLMVFSKSEFTEGARAYAKEKAIQLVRFEDM